MNKHYLYVFSAFIAGMVVMATEMSSTRLLAPYFGNSLYVWTHVIGLIMLALSAGYYYGGRLADKYPKDILYYGVIFAAGLWIVLIPFVSKVLFPLLTMSFSNLALVTQWGSFIAVGILFVVPMIFLGTLLPFTIKLVLLHVRHTGSICGKISMISTLGSLLGTFLPAFVLIPFLGTTKTFVLLGLVLIFLAAFGLRKWWLFVLGALSFLLYWIVPPVYAHESIIATKNSPYGFIFITEDAKGLRRLHVDNPLGTQSVYDPNGLVPPEPYYYSYFAVLPSMLDQPKSVLILGHAGGTFTRLYNAFYPELHITGVELDPAITKMAEQWMGLSEAHVDIVHADARTYLMHTDRTFDLILIDTYRSSSIPFYLATTEFFDLTSEHMNEGGVVALNASAGESQFLSVLINSFVAHFENNAVLKISDSTNTMILGSDTNTFKIENFVSSDLNAQVTYTENNLLPIFHDAKIEMFLDEKSSRVEILADEMLREIMRTF